MAAFGQVSDCPSANTNLIVRVAIGVYTFTVLAIVPFAGTPVPEIPGVQPIVGSVVMTSDLSSCFLLISIFRELRRLSLLILACAYLHGGSMALLSMLTFPEVLLRGGVLFGNAQSAAWAFLSFWVGYGALSLAAMALEAAGVAPLSPGRVRFAMQLSLGLTVPVIAGVAISITLLADDLPPLLNGSAFTITLWLPRCASIVSMMATTALGLMVVGRRSTIFLWLSLAVAMALGVNILSLGGGGRNTLGWTLGRVNWMVSSSVLFLFFLRQFAHQLRILSHARAELEQSVQDRTNELIGAVRQRDLLLREVYHRVKNNMQLVDSMLFLEGRRIVDPVTKDMIDVLRHRVFALGLVHQQVMSSKNMEFFNIGPFLRQLLDNLGTTRVGPAFDLCLDLAAEPIEVNLDVAIPIGLLLTELIFESIRRAGVQRIAVTLQRDESDRVRLTVTDDGEGFARPFQREPRGGIGSLIVSGLVGQLGGQLRTTQDGDHRVEIILPIPEKASNERYERADR